MSQIFGIFRNRNIAKITVPSDSARFFALRPLQYMDFFTFLQVIFFAPTIFNIIILLYYAACFISRFIPRRYLRNSSIGTNDPSRFSADQ